MKKTLYIIHGWTYTIEPWTSVVSILRSKGIEVKQLRVPGLTSESKKVWDIDSYVEWLHGELKQAKNPNVLGHSNGGRIALNYVKKYPGSIGHLILLNAAGINVSNKKVSLKRSLFRLASKIAKPLKHIPIVRKVVYKIIGASDYDRAPKNMKKTLQNMLQSDHGLVLNDIQTHTTLLWGKQDSATPLALGEKMASQLPHAKIHRFKDWAHAPYITHPNQVADAIIKVLEKQS